MKLNIGSGGTKIKGYISVDKYHDGADVKAPANDTGYKSETVSEIFCSHMIEHIELDEFKMCLDHWYDILKIGGKMHLMCPNAEVYVKEWLYAAQSHNYESLSGWATRNVLGWENHGKGMLNRNLFTPQFLEFLVGNAGFDVEKCVVTETRVKVKNHVEYRENGDIQLVARKMPGV